MQIVYQTGLFIDLKDLFSSPLIYTVHDFSLVCFPLHLFCRYLIIHVNLIICEKVTNKIFTEGTNQKKVSYIKLCINVLLTLTMAQILKCFFFK